MAKKINLKDVHIAHIDGTKPKEHVRIMDIYLCCISHPVKKAIGASLMKVYITTKTLKHIYDRYCHEKKLPDVYENIIMFLADIIENPHTIKKNKPGKNAEFVFLREIYGDTYACPVEKVKQKKRKKVFEILYIETAFVLKKQGKYLENNKILFPKQ